MGQSGKMVEIDLGQAEDIVAQTIRLVWELKRRHWYNPEWLCCGFNAESIGQRNSAENRPGSIFAVAMKKLPATKKQFEKLLFLLDENPLQYAIDFPEPAIAIYDPQYMQEVGIDEYRILSEQALIVTVLIK